jgi:hypothetical protein
VNGAIMTLARYYAKQAVKAQYQRQGIRWQHTPGSVLHDPTMAYLDRHCEELVALATTSYRSFVESGLLRPERKRRKPNQ